MTQALTLSTGLFFIALSMIYIFRPFFRPSMTPALAQDLQDLRTLVFAKRRILQNLKDLAEDHALKKIGEQNYLELKNQMLIEAEEVYTALESLQGKSVFLQKLENDLENHRREVP